ncbi:MAG: TonB-dependent receptor [Bacteroidia bacterium]|nr:TonB-dependent receptor [Bacteroidia bacterium]
MRVLITAVLLLFIQYRVQAQAGGLAGAVTDAITGRELVGVQVILKPGLIDDATDVEGRFLFSGIEPGIYSLELREPNHKTTYVPLLRVSANEITVVRIAMFDSVKVLTGAVITARKPQKNNNAGVASERKSSPSIMDGVSQETIKTTPDRNTAEVLRRVSGIAIQDNKYPIVRGLSDRYNLAMLNGVPMPSTTPDRKSFAFDVIPSNLLDNLLVLKSGMPDQPGEFAGAVLLVNMRDVPDENVQTFSLGFGGYTNTVGKQASWQTNKGADFAGLGNSGRLLPSGMPASGDYMANLTRAERAAFSKKFENDWGLKSSTTLPALQFQFSNSSRFLFSGRPTGVLFALSYSNLKRINSIDRAEFNTSANTRKYTDKQFTDNVLLGGILNFAIKVNKKNKITWRNFVNNNAFEENNVRTGTDFERGSEERSWGMNYSYNYFLGSQLSGDHFIPAWEVKFKWDASAQVVNRNAPDYRRLLYTRNMGTNDPFKAAIGPGASFANAGKMYTQMQENIRFAGYSFLKSFLADRYKTDIKIGGFHQIKNREFKARVLSVVDNSFDTPDSLKQLAPEFIFAPENMGGDGFRYDEIEDPSYSYTGNSALHAGYIMADNIIDRFFRITGGVRIEKFYQIMKTEKSGIGKITPKIDNLNILPSLALTLLLNQRSNLRFSYAATVTRPDFREISPFSYFDFINFVSIVGNDTLKSGNINNFDFRYETFPGDGQSFSVGAFIKDFKNPVEQMVSLVSQDPVRSIQYKNAAAATVYGAEMEFRYKLKKVAYKLRNFEMSGNLAYTFSEVRFQYIDSSGKAANVARPLQGQSPYIINWGLYYNNRARGVSFAVNYNTIGPRLYSVGTTNYPDFYEKPRHVLDLQISKAMSQRAEFKLTLGDVLFQDFVLYQNADDKHGYKKTDKVVNRMKTAPLVLLNFTYRIK